MKYPDFSIKGKIALVTGAASGLGEASALGLAKYGANIVLVDINGKGLNRVAGLIKALNRRAWCYRVDIKRISAIKTTIDKVEKECGRIDILLNSAGLNIQQWAEEVTEEAWDSINNVNTKGLFFVCQAVGKVMMKQKYGRIINISSDAGSVALIRRAAYCTSKGGVNQLTKVLALEWAKYNINVNAIAPSFIATPLAKSFLKEKAIFDYVMENTPLKRVGDPVDVASAVVFLASNAGNYITGHILQVDGGWTCH